jgi:putative peptidoglycan lipid II flippase
MIDPLRTGLERWGAWSKRSVNRRIFAATLTVGGFTLVVNLASTAKELVVAHQFGTDDALDAFLIAFLLPSFFVMVVTGSFSSAFMPTYIQVREHDGQAVAQRLFSNVIIWSAAALIVASFLLVLLAPYILPVLASGFGPEKLALTRSLLYVLLPALVISGFAAIWRGILNAGERFALAAVTPIMAPVTAVVVLLAMGQLWGIYALAIGTVGGFALEAGLLAWGLKRRGFYLIPRWYGMDPATRQVISQYVPMVAGIFLVSGTSVVDQSIAAMLGSGSVSALNYGNKITALLTGVGSMALGTAVLPYFSRMVAVRDWSGIQHTLKTYTRLILLATIPLTLVLAYFSEPLVGLLFQRGAFTAADTRLVGQVQALYLLQIPCYVLSMLIVRLISSLKANSLLMWGAVISFFANVILDYVFALWLGVAGIALSTAVVVSISCCYLSYVLLRLMRRRALFEQG